jgi:hypothetical protein
LIRLELMSNESNRISRVSSHRKFEKKLTRVDRALHVPKYNISKYTVIACAQQLTNCKLLRSNLQEALNTSPFTTTLSSISRPGVSIILLLLLSMNRTNMGEKGNSSKETVRKFVVCRTADPD